MSIHGLENDIFTSQKAVFAVTLSASTNIVTSSAYCHERSQDIRSYLIN